MVADYIPAADTVYVSEGGEASFTNTSENANNFFWLYSDGQQDPDNSVNGQHTYTEPGVYNVILFAQNTDGCFDIYENEIVVLLATGVNEISRDNGLIRSYISYTGGTTQYVIELEDSKTVNIQMVNTSGQVLYNQNINVNGETRVDLPVGNLSAGMYMIITLADGTRIDTQKLFVR